MSSVLERAQSLRCFVQVKRQAGGLWQRQVAGSQQLRCAASTSKCPSSGSSKRAHHVIMLRVGIPLHKVLQMFSTARKGCQCAARCTAHLRLQGSVPWPTHVCSKYKTEAGQSFATTWELP